MKPKTHNEKKGQAALIAVILMLVIMLSAVLGTSAIALKEAKVAESDRKSRLAFFAEEAAIEDAIYRTKRGKNLGLSVVLNLNDSTATATITTVASVREIISKGSALEHKRASKVVLNSVSGINFPYGAQVDAGGLEMDESTEIRGAGGTVGNVYSNGPATGANNAKITGDLTISGANSVDEMEVWGTVRANTITDTEICGNAYYQSIDADSLDFLNDPSSPTCSAPLTPGTANPGSSNSPVVALPITDAQIQGWKNDAEAGGIINGNCGDSGASGCDIPNNGTLSLGPKKINGNLVLTSRQTLVVTGTLYFTGNIDIDSSSGAIVRCSAGFGASSCIIIADGWVHIQNNATFQGSGTAGSYIMLLSTIAGCNGGGQTAPCTHHNAGMDLHNNATGAIFYVPDSMINLHNGVNVSEITAYKLRLDNNAVITYESGLANAQFSSGPSGGWDIISWEEIIP